MKRSIRNGAEMDFINDEKLNVARTNEQELYIPNVLTDTVSWDESFDYLTKVVEEESNIKLPGKYFTIVTHTAHTHIHKVHVVNEHLKNIKNRNDYPVEAHMYMGLTGMSESFGPHSDDCEVLFWQCIGRTQWTVNDNIYILCPSDCIYVPRGMQHDVKSLSPRMGISFGF